MSNFKLIAFMMILTAAGLMIGCQAVNEEEASAADLEATVAAQVEATVAAEATQQAQIDAAVAGALATAVPPAVDAAVESAMASTEEELLVAIDQAVDDALVAAENTAAAAAAATADDQVTSTEIETVAVTAAAADEALAEAEALVAHYFTQYEEIAQSTINELNDIENELATLNESVQTINTTLVAMNETLAAGLAIADETIQELETVAQQTSAAIQSAQQQANEWITAAQAEWQTRQAEWAAIAPTTVATSGDEALAQTLGYVTALQESLSNGTLSADEATTLLQLGQNASASLRSLSFDQMADAVTQANTAIINGNWPSLTAQMSSIRQNFTEFQGRFDGAGRNLPQPGNGRDRRP